MSASLPAQLFNLAEPIPGYRVQERLGAGGYGEVWKAVAPGGIAKAIKIVYGCHDDQRTARELTSLNRIKEVRHPFLLSLERIELIDSHLIIVSELATSSLKHLFDKYRESGLSGIPRELLLTHLRDTADALDYICQEHTLQHLDVKPENLLLVGGRIKVADFGLVKDLQDVHCSIVGGLTPVYAAPELFDGRPNNRSDQYSLAIVYQEMLTGFLPFEGRTTAQLAAQHLHSRPRLDSLPMTDQPVIGRALSKKSEQRFSSCREMVDHLMQPARGQRAPMGVPSAAPVNRYTPAVAAQKTEVISSDQSQAGVATAQDQGFSTQPDDPPPPVVDLPPLEAAPGDVEYRPTVFIGIGGLAALTLRALQNRLSDRFGDLHGTPALQILLFDTDIETLQQATAGEGPEVLHNDMAIHLPLRQPTDYRRESANHLQWLSRRWLFNIPRSLQTQGFRPLGRLAFADHTRRVAERIERAIQAAIDSDGLAATAEQTGLPFREGPPRVFIVSSTSGGTGSGMVLDVGYLVRSIFRELELPEDGICGILAHCAGRNQRARELAAASSYAFIAELHHYRDLHQGYPSEFACSFPAGQGPFESTYIVNLGEELEPEGFAAAADRLAEYIYRSSVTPATAFFDKCRREQGGPNEGSTPMVGTFGLSQLGISDESIPAGELDSICRALISRCRGTVRQTSESNSASLADPNSLLTTHFAAGKSEDELRSEAASRAHGLELDTARIASQLCAAAIRELGSDPEAYVQTVLEELVSKYRTAHRKLGAFPPGALIAETLDTLIRSQSAQNAQRVCLESVLEKHVKQIADEKAVGLQEWVRSLIASPQYGVAGAQRAAGHVADYLRTLSRKAAESLEAPRREIRGLEQALQSENREWLRMRGMGWNRKLTADPQITYYFRLRIDELTLNGVCQLCSKILAHMAALDDKLRNMSATLERVIDEFNRRPAEPALATSKPNEVLGRFVANAIEARKTELLAEMERELESDLQSISALDESHVSRVLPQALRRVARTAVLRELKRVSSREITAPRDGAEESPFSLTTALSDADLELSDCGGARRLLLVAPEDVPVALIVKQLCDKLAQAPTIVADQQSDVLLCYEGSQLPLRRVATSLLDGRYQFVEVASRLHTRVDVPWTPL